MTNSVFGLCVIAAFCAVGALCGACLAAVSFERKTKKKLFVGALLDFAATSLPGCLFFVVLSELCGGELRLSYIVFCLAGGIAGYLALKKHLSALRRKFIASLKANKTIRLAVSRLLK